MAMNGVRVKIRSTRFRNNEWGQSKNSLDPFQKDPAIMANFYSDPVRLSHSGEFLL
jgi:hypothetical protein